MNQRPDLGVLARSKEEFTMRKIVTALVLASSFAIASCNTVRGAAEDVKSVADCTQDMINRGEC
jgi:predicted small secreted protein